MEFTQIPSECSQLVAVHPWERTMVQQRLEDLGIPTRLSPDGQLLALLDPGEAGIQQARQLQLVLFRFRGRRGEMIDWLENCWSR
ncbi:Asr1405/Asl0597 family protein [Gloeobacter kilaueensis]|uniref:DUF2007 domain-containing protein n=1 Tax=Gloeobacter kilaueensis (strain ATCC BAA-2537 / CCAP 1431/1 / ULC 316 / JS1) TaxID=1183438 RepID=U5QD93_GLOK1|nr:Asr1405/Asl0597 family protein [Gloeobacter kilaueensis]AGY56803.1 hypothetical protein GKIL_0557 [Gloeobacter kilaueensis JS1]